MTMSLVTTNAALVLGLMTFLWLASIKLRDVSIVDPWWSIAFLIVTAHTAVATGLGPRKLALLVLVGLWALRLFVHLFRRSLGKPEDPRYTAFRVRFGAERYWWFSLFQVFLLQGSLALLVSAPLQLAASRSPDEPFRILDGLGLALFAVGFAFEATADHQLQVFRDNPANKGRVLDRGLFAWTRHPNYFGEAVLWWGFGCFALDSLAGAATLLGPVLMTFLLVRVSGVSMLDEHLSRTRAGYADYVARTSGFFPRRPRQGG